MAEIKLDEKEVIKAIKDYIKEYYKREDVKEVRSDDFGSIGSIVVVVEGFNKFIGD